MRAVLCLVLCVVAANAQPWMNPWGNPWGGAPGFGYPNQGYSGYAPGYPGYGPGYGAPYAPYGPTVSSDPAERLLNILVQPLTINYENFRNMIRNALQQSTLPTGSEAQRVFDKVAIGGVVPTAVLRRYLVDNKDELTAALGNEATTGTVKSKSADIEDPTAQAPQTICTAHTDCNTNFYCSGRPEGGIPAVVGAPPPNGTGLCLKLSQIGEKCGTLTNTPLGAVTLQQLLECAPGLECDNTSEGISEPANIPNVGRWGQCVKVGVSAADALNNEKTIEPTTFWNKFTSGRAPNDFMNSDDFMAFLADARDIDELTDAQKDVATQVWSSIAGPQTRVRAGDINTFFNRNPNAVTALRSKASVCTDSDSFNAGWGACSTYKRGMINHPFCVPDGAAAQCPVSCGTCGTYNAPLPRWGL